jgi:hypothetical protein
MRRDKASYLRAGVISAILLAGPSSAFAQAGGTLQYPSPSVGGNTRPYPPGAQPNKAVPNEPDKGISGSSGESLSHQLDRSGGVIHPPTDVDPGLTQPAPQVGPRSTPVIPPPGTPGGNPDVKPK